MRRLAALSLLSLVAFTGWFLLVSEPAAEIRVETHGVSRAAVGSDAGSVIVPSVESADRVRIEVDDESGESSAAPRVDDASGAIAVLVLDESGVPAADATVELRVLGSARTAEDPDFTARTGIDGRVEVAAPHRVDCEVVARSTDAISRRAAPIRSGESVTIRLERATAFFGRLLSREDGRPVPDALLVLIADGITHAATSDSDGGFRFQAFRDREARLEVLAAGYERLRTQVAPAAEPRVLRLARGRTLSGIVVRVGGSNAVSNATVEAIARRRVGPLRASLVLARATSDGLGRFQLDGVPEDGFEIIATDGRDRGGREIDHEPIGPVRIELPDCRSFRGIVTRRDGEPAKNAFVSLIDATAFDAASRRVRCDEQGRFELGALRDDRPLRAVITADGCSPAIVELAIGAAEATFRLESGNVLTGIVRTPEGAPIADARVELADDSPSVLRAARSKRDARTDSAGRYRFEELPSIPMRVRADAGNGCSALVPVELTAAATLQLDLVADRRESLAGTVLADSGRPIDGARIRVEPVARVEPLRTARSGTDGRFRVDGLDRGAWRVTFEAEGHARLTTDVVLPRDGDLLARLLPGATVRGRVIAAATKAAVESFSIRIETLAEGERVALRKQTFHPIDGWFEIDDLPRGDLFLVVRADGYRSFGPHGFDPASRSPIEIQLDSAASVKGRLVDERKSPIVGARVFVRPREPVGTSVVGAFTKADGSFVIEDLPYGDTEIGVGDPVAPIAILATSELRSGERDLGERVISAPGSLAIEIREGLLTPNSRVVLRGRRSRTKLEFATTGESIFAAPLFPDRYLVELDRPNTKDLEQDVDVGAEKTARVVFEDTDR